MTEWAHAGLLPDPCIKQLIRTMTLWVFKRSPLFIKVAENGILEKKSRDHVIQSSALQAGRAELEGGGSGTRS